MAARRGSWTDKIEGGRAPQLVRLDKAKAGGRTGDVMYVPSPQVVRDYVRGIPSGQRRGIQDMKDDFVASTGAHCVCPVASSMFIRYAAEEALDSLNAGAPAEAVTPFWRIVDPEGAIARKLSCGPDYIAKLRSMEAAR